MMFNFVKKLFKHGLLMLMLALMIFALASLVSKLLAHYDLTSIKLNLTAIWLISTVVRLCLLYAAIEIALPHFVKQQQTKLNAEMEHTDQQEVKEKLGQRIHGLHVCISHKKQLWLAVIAFESLFQLIYYLG